MTEKTFEETLIQSVQNRILQEISKTDFTKLDYNQRKSLPDNVLSKIWADVDWEEVINRVKPEMERRICNAIVGNMETELKTDIKKLLAVDGVREKLRIEIYPKLMAVLNEE